MAPEKMYILSEKFLTNEYVHKKTETDYKNGKKVREKDDMRLISVSVGESQIRHKRGNKHMTSKYSSKNKKKMSARKAEKSRGNRKYTGKVHYQEGFIDKKGKKSKWES